MAERDPLLIAMRDALIEQHDEWERLGLSTLGYRLGLADRSGIIRLTVEDIARICARIAREHLGADAPDE